MDRDAQSLLGRSDLATTLCYRHTRDDRKHAAVEALDYGLQNDSRTSRVPSADAGARAL
jgi:hypothetical protein